MQRLLVSVRGWKEAIEAGKGGCHITDVEYPASALGTPYPLNILAVRNSLNRNNFAEILVSTNIGEEQTIRSTACQAAIGVGVAGANIIKCGLANLKLNDAIKLDDAIVRSVRKFLKNKRIIPAVFIDTKLKKIFNPFKDGIRLLQKTKADGLLIDTFNKNIGKGLLDYCNVKDIESFVRDCHKINKEAWIAGSITLHQLAKLWETGVDVICVRGAACEQDKKGRFGKVTSEAVGKLAATLP